MSTPRVIHGSFTIERRYPAPVARVFRALSDPARKRRWFAEGEGFVIDSYELDFRVGGFERTRFRYGEDGPPMTYDGVYLDIVDQARVVLAYSMTIGGAPLSSSLATMELAAGTDDTLLIFTEHTAFTDGKDGRADRRAGTEGLLDALGRELASNG